MSKTDKRSPSKPGRFSFFRRFSKWLTRFNPFKKKDPGGAPNKRKYKHTEKLAHSKMVTSQFVTDQRRRRRNKKQRNRRNRKQTRLLHQMEWRRA